MSMIIVTFLIIGYCLIATEHINKINKAAVAMFLGVVCWVLYITMASDFVQAQYGEDFAKYLGGASPTITAAKRFIAQHVFLGYVANICEIVFFLLATMSIIEVLENNGCFDFLSKLMRTRNSKKLLWMLAFITYLLSANVDNLTAASMMLVIMHGIVPNRTVRKLYGAVIVLAANSGGLFTVIGDVTSLALWVKGAVTPTAYSAALFLPSLVALSVPTYLISRVLPDYLDSLTSQIVYRGDDYKLSNWQRLLMFFVGIGGLWFIPTFHNLTKLSPFVGALCVLSLLWVVNEIFNRKLMNSDQMYQRRFPQVLQYSNIQTILYFIGLSLAVAALQEAGALRVAAQWCDANIGNIYIMSLIWGLISSVLDNIALVLSSISMYVVGGVSACTEYAVDPVYHKAFLQNGSYWELVSYSGAIGGTLLTIGSMAGYALMKFEKVTLFWYLKNISGKVFVGWLAGLAVYFLTANIF